MPIGGGVAIEPATGELELVSVLDPALVGQSPVKSASECIRSFPI